MSLNFSHIAIQASLVMTIIRELLLLLLLMLVVVVDYFQDGVLQLLYHNYWMAISTRNYIGLFKGIYNTFVLYIPDRTLMTTSSHFGAWWSCDFVIKYALLYKVTLYVLVRALLAGSKYFNAVHKDDVVILEVETEGEGIMQPKVLPSAPPPSIKDSTSSGGVGHGLKIMWSIKIPQCATCIRWLLLELLKLQLLYIRSYASFWQSMEGSSNPFSSWRSRWFTCFDSLH